MINFLEETEKALKNHGFSLNNVRCIRNAEGYIPLSVFVEKAYNFNYDNGPGEVNVDSSLIIIGSFWWLTRESMGGVEGWVYHHKPKKPALQAGDFVIKNRRHTDSNSFMERVEKCGGYFNEQERTT